MEFTNEQGQLFGGRDEDKTASADKAQGPPDERRELKVRINFDGGSKGNPGPAFIGAVIAECPRDPADKSSGEILVEISESIGRGTNNFAEYTALIRSLEKVLELKAVSVECISDSELVVRQMTGRYRVKSEALKPLWQTARELSRRFARFSIRHVLRSENRHADRLATEAYKASKNKA